MVYDKKIGLYLDIRVDKFHTMKSEVKTITHHDLHILIKETKLPNKQERNNNNNNNQLGSFWLTGNKS